MRSVAVFDSRQKTKLSTFNLLTPSYHQQAAAAFKYLSAAKSRKKGGVKHESQTLPDPCRFGNAHHERRQPERLETLKTV
jgi:hypothetical protein